MAIKAQTRAAYLAERKRVDDILAQRLLQQRAARATSKRKIYPFGIEALSIFEPGYKTLMDVLGFKK